MFWHKRKNYPIQVCDWLAQVERRLWVTTHKMTVGTPVGDVTIPDAFETDLFSKVPDTDHPEFWLASVVHDFMRKSKRWTRAQADIAFGYIMNDAAVVIRARMLEEGASERQADKVCIRLMRVGSLYLVGVSGLLGSAYMGIGRLKDKLLGR